MKELLALHGFTYHSSCSCDGHRTEKYRKPEYEVKIRPKQNRFRIRKNGSWLMQWTNITELENKLTELCGVTLVANQSQ